MEVAGREREIILYPCEKFAARITRRQCIANIKKALLGIPGYRNFCLTLTEAGAVTNLCADGATALAELKTTLDDEPMKTKRGANCTCKNCGRKVKYLVRGRFCPGCDHYRDDPAALAAAAIRFRTGNKKRGPRRASIERPLAPPKGPALPPAFTIIDEISEIPGGKFEADTPQSA